MFHGLGDESLGDVWRGISHGERARDVSYPAGDVIIDFLGDSEGVSLLRALLFAVSTLVELMI